MPYSKFLDRQAAPSIPVQPISYGDAEHFLSQLDDYDAPDEWMGGLNITYKIAQSQTKSLMTKGTSVTVFQLGIAIHFMWTVKRHDSFDLLTTILALYTV